MSDTIPEEITELAQRIVAQTDYEHDPQKRTELVAAAILAAEKRGEERGMERAAEIAGGYKRDASFDDSMVGALEHNANQMNIAAAILSQANEGGA